MDRPSREGGGLVQWFFWAQKSWLVVMPGLCLNNIRPITFSEWITHRELGRVMPTNRTTLKKSPIKKSGRTSKSTASPSKVKHDVPSKPLLDFQTTLPEDFYAPSVWEAHQVLLKSNEESALAWPGYPPDEEAWSYFTQFLQQLHLEDLRKALESSAMLMGHPLVFDQIWHFYRMSRMETVESFTESKNAMPHLLTREEQGAAYNPMFITTQARGQAQDALLHLCKAQVGVFLPGYILEKKVMRPDCHRPSEKTQDVDDGDEVYEVATYRKMLDEYESLCIAVGQIFHCPPTQLDISGPNKKRFWKWETAPRNLSVFVEKIGRFLQAVHDPSQFDFPESSSPECEGHKKSSRKVPRGPLTQKIKTSLVSNPVTIFSYLDDLLEDVSGPPDKDQQTMMSIINESDEAPIPQDMVRMMIDYARERKTVGKPLGHTVNPERLVFALLAYSRCREFGTEFHYEADKIRRFYDDNWPPATKIFLKTLLYPPST